MEKLIKSRERVSKFAEVYTPSFVVKDMCDLVGDILKFKKKHPCGGSTWKVLEPACGNGNFLVEILDRKLSLITHNFELNALIAVSSLYGVDIQEDNCKECRERLYTLVLSYGETDKDILRKILDKNIICGNTLTQQTSQNTDLIFTDYVFQEGKILCMEHSFKDMLNGITDNVIKEYLL